MKRLIVYTFSSAFSQHLFLPPPAIGDIFLLLLWIALVLHQTIQKAFTIFTRACLPDVDYFLFSFIRFSEKEVHAALLKVLTILALIQLNPRDLICHTGSVNNGALNTSTDISIHQIQLYILSVRCHIKPLTSLPFSISDL